MARRKKTSTTATLAQGASLVVAGIVLWQTGDFIQGLVAFFGVFIGLALALLLWRMLKPSKRRSLSEIDAMTGREFEEFLGELFKRHGYKTKVTSASGDYGADLILHKDGQKIVVQAKRYKNNVGIRAVQEIIPAVAYYKADVAWVVTNSYLTKQAQNLADSNDVVIIDREELMKWL